MKQTHMLRQCMTEKALLVLGAAFFMGSAPPVLAATDDAHAQTQTERAEPAHPTTEQKITSPEQLPVNSEEPSLFPLYFSSGESDLRVDSEAILGYMAQSLLSAPADAMIRIEGRSDGVEKSPEGDSRDARLALSRARAENVKDYLVKKGIADGRFIVVGMGSSQPIGSIEGERDRERNRVVMVRLVRATSQSALPGRVTMASSMGSNVTSSPTSARRVDSGAGAATTGTSSGGDTAPGASGAGSGASGAAPGASGAVAGASSSSTGTAPAGVTGSGGPADAGAAAKGTPLVEPAPVKHPVEVIVIREREKPRGPAAVETVQLSLRMVKREGPGASGRTRWPINEFLQQEMPNLEKLFRSGLSRERALVGETLVSIHLDGSGAVTQAEVALPYPQEAFQAEMVRYFMSWQLPPPPGNDQMSFVVALTVNATFQPFISPPR